MHTYDTTNRNAYIALGAVFGTLAGIGIGMLTAPRSGRETRERMREKARVAKQKAADQMAQKRQMAMDRFSRMRARKDEMSETVGDMAAGANDAAAARRRRTSGV